ncbi:MAG: class I SAM-dependent rRNA methyltransferase [Oscillospiraceae bacterium]|nr:class I SAM-dependent rRNA methyltransferase [Oscillospiraceae bacterium]MCI1990130.1 class I SAM-dependent rRNA methyltransferase [Oscillospiraceae bacterium]MCI2034509.1 class I SAM-dependent rRNA methyltransferase [Oscillospiraceae bacterium]
MKQIRPYPKVTVTRKAESSVLSGHPWIYNTELTNADPYRNGGLVDVLNPHGSYLGTGFINDRSKIRVRLISRNANDTFDEAFFERRLRYAWEYRKSVMGGDLSCCRVIFGEADSFPGLTVDRFGNILVTQTLSLGIEKIKPMLFRLLYEILTGDGQKIDGIYERNDVGIRGLEGMEQGKGFFPLDGVPVPGSTKTRISENGVEYLVDFENGQKTGFFLDQKYNRRAVARLCRGKRVLDCFTDTGSFALNAARAGAERVRSVDISATAIAAAQENARLNGLESRIDFETANVFDLLPKLAEEPGHDYDLVILDPPAFTKSRQTVRNAERGYKEINYRAMKLLPRGGYLATCSCSHFMTDELFRSVLRSAASDAQVSLRQIEARQQAPDHPILWNVPETDYLKFYIFQIV